MTPELPVTQILQPLDFASQVPELRYRQIDVAIAVEITTLDIGDAADLVQNHALRELLLTVVFENDDLSDFRIRWKDDAHGGNQQVEVTIFIDVERFNMDRSVDSIADHLFGE